MTKIKSKLLVSTTVLTSLVLYNQAINADTVRNDEVPIVQTTSKQQITQVPKVVDVQVSGEPNTETVGIEVFDPITVTVKTDHFTNDNLLTKDGLGWTDETEVQPIKGTATGTINNSRYWGQNNPTEPVTAYTFNNGDSGRITNIGETLSGIKLDLIYTVEDSDQDTWLAYSGLGRDGRTKGLAFTGEQYIKGTNNNSIVVLYNGANYIDIKYQIVRHDTFIEQPILVSFITTDIDVGQGVASDLANLALVIPKETNLSIKDGMIYDSSHTGPYHYGADLNGANGLPYGGYLGVSYLSKFNYIFFAPAPANDDIYKFATGVRYDLFGSALQTKLVINRQTHLTVKYVDDEGNTIQAATEVTGTNDFPQVPPAPTINGYQLNDTQTNILSPDEEEIIYQYLPEYHLTIEYLDEQGNKLASSQNLTAVKGALIQLKPLSVEGYQLPITQNVIISQNDTIKFTYSKQRLQTRVEYLDEQGRVLNEPQEITSDYGSQITLHPAPIAGFNSPGAKTIEVITNQTIRLVYTRKPSGGRPLSAISYLPIRRNLVHSRPINRPVYQSVVQVQPRVARLISIPKLTVPHFKIYLPTKHVNRQAQKEHGRNKFERNTGMNKHDQKIFFSVLEAIDKDGKKRGLNQQQRNLEQLYYIASANYSTSSPQRLTSNVKKYDRNSLAKIVGEKKATSFRSIVSSQSHKHKVDLSHLSITAASALDPDKGVQNIHMLATFPDQAREILFMIFNNGKSVTNGRGLPKNIEQWLYANGYYGDYIVDGDMSKEDRNADLDVYRIATSKKGLIQTLKDIYNSDESKLNRWRNNQERGMKERAKVNIIASQLIVGAMSIATAGLLAWKNWRTLKQAAKQAVNAVIHPVKTINKAVQKVKAGFSYVKKQVTNSKVYKVTKQFVTHPIRTANRIYQKTVNVVRQSYHKYVARPVQRFNNHVKRAVVKKYNSVRKSVSRFVSRAKTKVKNFFRRKR